MKKNGKIDEEEIVTNKFFEDEDGVAQQDFACLRNGWTWRFYKTFDWRELWDEFCTATEPDGRLKYRTALMFIKSKTKIKRERDLMYEIIGPRPILSKGEKLRAPWLGDWLKRRQNTFWSDEDPTKFIAVKRALKERTDKLEAMKAIGPLTLRWMARLDRLADKIDEAFAGNPLDPKYPPTHPKNINRIKYYRDWMKSVFAMNKKAWNAWLVANGVNPSSLSTFADMVVNGQGLPASNGNGMPAGQFLQLPEGVTADHILAGYNIKKKAEMFEMDLGPEYKTLEGEIVDEEEKKTRTH